MLLVFNVGNRVISLGFVKNGEVTARASLSSDKARTADEYALSLHSLLALHRLHKEDFEGAIGSSVVPSLTETVCDAISLVFSLRPHLLGGGIRTGLSIRTEFPAELGSDLVAAAVGALTRFAPPLLLVDFGTAITLSAVSAEKEFLGCAILPGLSLSSASLSEATALLPDVRLKAPLHAIGKTTTESLQSGRVFGTAAMVDGMVARMAKEMGVAPTVVLTGHSAQTVMPHLSTQAVYAEDLLFLGLEAIYQKNERKKSSRS